MQIYLKKQIMLKSSQPNKIWYFSSGLRAAIGVLVGYLVPRVPAGPGTVLVRPGLEDANVPLNKGRKGEQSEKETPSWRTDT